MNNEAGMQPVLFLSLFLSTKIDRTKSISESETSIEL